MSDNPENHLTMKKNVYFFANVIVNGVLFELGTY